MSERIVLPKGHADSVCDRSSEAPQSRTFQVSLSCLLKMPLYIKETVVYLLSHSGYPHCGADELNLRAAPVPCRVACQSRKRVSAPVAWHKLCLAPSSTALQKRSGKR